MCLACNILNAIGGTPKLTAPVYLGPLPGGIGANGQPVIAHLLPFSPEAIAQGMAIEEPEDPIRIPVADMALAAVPQLVTIGEFYAHLDAFLATLPMTAWHANRNQIADGEFLAANSSRSTATPTRGGPSRSSSARARAPAPTRSTSPARWPTTIASRRFTSTSC